MDWFKMIRAYWPAIVAVVTSLLVMATLSPLRDSQQMAGFFDILRWEPLGGLAFAVLYGGWVTFRLAQAEHGHGHLCPRCSGPLGHERDGRYGDYRQCLACGHNANHRHYR